MAKELVKIDLDEISLVDNPANQSAKVVLAKRADPNQEDNMADKEIEKADDAMKNRMKMYMDKGMSEKDAKMKAEMDMKKSAEDLLTEVDTLSVEVETLKSASAEKDAEIAKMKETEISKSEETFALDGQVIRKSDVSESVFTVLKKQAEDIAKMKSDQEMTELKKRAGETFANLGGSDDVKANILKFAEANAEVMEVLKAANEGLKEIFVEKGEQVVDDGSDPMTQVNKMAADYAVEHKVSKEAAFAEVTKSGEGRKLLIEARSK